MCGTGRALEACLVGDFGQAFHLNLLFPFWVGVIVLWVFDVFYAAAVGPEVPGPFRRLLGASAQNRYTLGALVVVWVGMSGYLNLFMRPELLR